MERFNRTLREQHLNHCYNDISDLDPFNKELIEYLLWYNLEKPHKALNCLSPMNYIILNFEYVIKKDYNNSSLVLKENLNDFISLPFLPKKSQMLWTSTVP
ncbi:MAG: integrase core domain-containing protein [Acidobacteriota bacterium]